jgi:hypothetical protein
MNPDDVAVLPEYCRKPPPIVCCECGKTCCELGEIQARELGWVGFSRLLTERLGACPSCIKEEHQRANAG